MNPLVRNNNPKSVRIGTRIASWLSDDLIETATDPPSPPPSTHAIGLDRSRASTSLRPLPSTQVVNASQRVSTRYNADLSHYKTSGNGEQVDYRHENRMPNDEANHNHTSPVSANMDGDPSSSPAGSDGAVSFTTSSDRQQGDRLTKSDKKRPRQTAHTAYHSTSDSSDEEPVRRPVKIQKLPVITYGKHRRSASSRLKRLPTLGASDIVSSSQKGILKHSLTSTSNPTIPSSSASKKDSANRVKGSQVAFDDDDRDIEHVSNDQDTGTQDASNETSSLSTAPHEGDESSEEGEEPMHFDYSPQPELDGLPVLRRGSLSIAASHRTTLPFNASSGAPRGPKGSSARKPLCVRIPFSQPVVGTGSDCQRAHHDDDHDIYSGSTVEHVRGNASTHFPEKPTLTVSSSLSAGSRSLNAMNQASSRDGRTLPVSNIQSPTTSTQVDPDATLSRQAIHAPLHLSSHRAESSSIPSALSGVTSVVAASQTENWLSPSMEFMKTVPESMQRIVVNWADKMHLNDFEDQTAMLADVLLHVESRNWWIFVWKIMGPGEHVEEMLHEMRKVKLERLEQQK